MYVSLIVIRTTFMEYIHARIHLFNYHIMYTFIIPDVILYRVAIVRNH